MSSVWRKSKRARAGPRSFPNPWPPRGCWARPCSCGSPPRSPSPTTDSATDGDSLMRNPLVIALLGLLVLAACSRCQTPSPPPELSAGTTCALDGMLLNDCPGPTAQTHYAEGNVEFYCDT